MADYIERGPLLEAFKAKCCEDCPGGYDRAKCKSWCNAADEIALVEDAPAVVPDVQRWRKTAEEPPTEADANEDGDVLSINNNPSDGFITNWPWNMVAAFPENLTVWMPMPKRPGERPKKLYWREETINEICPVCGYECNDDYYLDKYCPGCGTRLWFNEEEAEHDQPDM